MKNFIKEVKLFISSNKILTLAFCIATIIFISYEITKDFPEMIYPWDFLFYLVSQVSLSFVGCFIFYIMQVYIPDRNKKINAAKQIRQKLRRITDIMLKSIEELCKLYLDKFDIQKLTQNDFDVLGKKITFLNELKEEFPFRIKNHESEITYGDYIVKNKKEIEYLIDKINIYYGNYLEESLVKLLDDVTNSAYHTLFLSIKESEERLNKKLDILFEEEKQLMTALERKMDKRNPKQRTIKRIDLDLSTFIKDYYDMYFSILNYVNKAN
ncbi:TPA: hypothetical protein UNK14_001536 [Clostridioides difficile]|uniref:hypothetical protein n=2 Tax=Clostridioides difficile TaxID=1496 RepID=UPI00093B4C9B|nr:hypothetical protein [Clostridioides difficile]EGT4599358.1 hypothetical protein [Clostridioides difficile]EII6780909.1 hypothetical protein [Clostridioides difficile]MBY1461873.1 hypothetical protein [Clostridioides difficile]MBY1771447.1 hypothetical protein [Clostridioides difficile]MBY2242507.1 hypothetical protein [Clostridioides difficile]